MYETNVENIKHMLSGKKLSNAEIAEMLNVSVKLVEEIASGKAS